MTFDERETYERMLAAARLIKRRRHRRLPGEEPEFPASEKRPYRTSPPMWVELPGVDVAAVRRKTGFSQERFAHRFAIPLSTLRHWEQGTRRPRGSALALLHVIAFNAPIAVRAIVRARQRRLFGE